MGKKDYAKIGKQILELIGGKDNISLFTHCITRLRFEVKDQSKINAEALGKEEGVIGTSWVGTQFQIIIGTDVGSYYEAICNIAGLERETMVEEILDQEIMEKRKLSAKQLGTNVIKYVSGSMMGILPLLIGCSLVRAVMVLLGPSVLKLVSETSGLYLMGNMIYDACFYFLPILLGYTAAKQLRINPIYGMFIGAVLIVPDFVAMTAEGTAWSVLGLSVPLNTYGQTFLPVVLGVWILTYVNKLARKVSPKNLVVLLEPLITLLIMTPLMFFICGPIGTYFGNILNNVFGYLASGNVVLVVLADILLTVSLPYIVLCGMHLALIVTAIGTFAAAGSDSFILVETFGYNFVLFGIAFGTFLKAKGQDKSYLGGAVVTGLLGGVSEPIIYGCLLKYKGALKATTIALAITGLYQGIFQPVGYCIPGLNNIFMVLPFFAGGSNSALISGIVYVVLAFALGLICAYLFIKPNRLIQSN